MASCTSFISWILSIISFLCSLFNIPFYAVGDEVKMQDFTLTFSDEFDEKREDIWTGHFQYGNETAVRKGCCWNSNLTEIRDGNLIIPCVYLPDGMGNKGAGWYSAGIDTADSFSQRYGYFECRCILPEGADVWSAFWLFCSGAADISGEGEDGTEIDIMESTGKRKTVQHNLHYNGYEEAHKSMGPERFRIKEGYNTFGLEWNEDGYIFYINGRESMRTSFGGVSKVPEYIVLSLEMKGENGVPSGRENAPGESTEFIVDYVRAYQYKELL